MRVSRFLDRTDTVYHFLIAFLVYLIGGLPILAYALPQGGTIASGTGSIDTSGSSLTVTQTTNKIIINWESFSIGNNESVIFIQPESSASALNNILGSSRTVPQASTQLLTSERICWLLAKTSSKTQSESVAPFQNSKKSTRRWRLRRQLCVRGFRGLEG